MTNSNRSLHRFITLAFCAVALSSRAQWNQNNDAGPYIYTDPANWVGGAINNLLSTAPANGLNLMFTNDFILTNGVVLGFPGASNITFRSDSAAPRTLHISLGNFLRTNQTGGTITIGTNGFPLILDLYNHTRSLGGVGSSGSPANSGTMNVYAQIIDTGSFGTNGVALGVGNMYTYLLNNSNSFTGPVSFGFRGGGFSSVTNIGGGPSALGAPIDSTNGTVTVTDSTSSGLLVYHGKGDSTDRPFVWNLTGSLFVFENRGSGKITFTGPWTLPYAANRTNILTVNAASNHIEFDGFMNGLNGTVVTMTNLVLKGNYNTNRIILTCPTNNFAALEFTNVVLAFNSITPAGSPSPLGTNGIIVHRGNAANTGNAGNGTGSANPSANGASLQYFGPSATFSRTIQISGTGYSWGIDNAGVNSTLTISSDLVNGFTGAGSLPRWIYFNADVSATNVMAGLIPEIGPGTTVVVANPPGYTLSAGNSCVRLLNPANSFIGGVQVKYGRNLEVAALADIGQPSSIGTGSLPPFVNSVQMTGINLGSTDSQRGGIFTYIGSNNGVSNQRISIFGLGAASFGTINNNSPNNSSLHFSDTGLLNFNPSISHCALNLGGSASAINTFDPIIPDAGTTNNLTGLVVNGSTWRLTASHSYTGTTTVTNGTLLLDGAIGSGAGLSGDVNVWQNGILGGTGTINNNVIVQTNGTLAPGDLAIGSLTINGNLTNYGTIAVEINKSDLTQDQITGLNNLVYGGTLFVTNLAGSLAPGDSFPLFSATTYLGSFASVSPASPGSGLAWDLTGLTNGTLKVVTGPANPPSFTGVTLANNGVIITGTGGIAGNNYYVLTATNLAPPVTWNKVMTNAFGPGGSFVFTNNIDPAIPQEFFRLQLP